MGWALSILVMRETKCTWPWDFVLRCLTAHTAPEAAFRPTLLCGPAKAWRRLVEFQLIGLSELDDSHVLRAFESCSGAPRAPNGPQSCAKAELT